MNSIILGIILGCVGGVVGVLLKGKFLSNRITKDDPVGHVFEESETIEKLTAEITGEKNFDENQNQSNCGSNGFQGALDELSERQISSKSKRLDKK